MRQNYFFEYVPNAYISLCVDKAQQMANNRFVYDFKAGDKETVKICAEWLVRYLTKQYSSILEDFVIVFAPCSTQWKYAKRFGYLAAILNAAGIATSVDIRILMREAVLSGATIMAFVHNHPSGNTQPSKADDVLTQQIAKACQVMRIFFMDHVIVTDGAFYSYHDKGRL